MNDSRKKKDVWGPWATIGLSLIIGILCTVVQIITAIVYLIVLRTLDPSLEIQGAALTLADNGLFLSVSTIICFPINAGLIFLFCWLRRGIRTRDYLALRHVAAKTTFLCIGVGLTIQLLGDLLGLLLKHPIPEFMISAYTTAGSLPLLWIAVCVLAPITEEIFFRGFLYTGLSRSRLGAVGAILITSLCWAALHIQYDAFIIATIFVYGLTLGIVRAKTRSVLPTILIHMAINLISTIQVTFLIHG